MTKVFSFSVFVLCAEESFCPFFGNIVGVDRSPAPTIFQFPIRFGEAADKDIGDKQQGRRDFPQKVQVIYYLKIALGVALKGDGGKQAVSGLDACLFKLTMGEFHSYYLLFFWYLNYTTYL